MYSVYSDFFIELSVLKIISILSNNNFILYSCIYNNSNNLIYFDV